MRVSALVLLAAAGVARAAYWMEQIAHQGKSPYHPDPNYQVFRNVKDFGAVGDGVHDDTVAINKAISSGGRCGPGTCKGETTSPATVYFPPGTYLISDSILDYFYTQIIGDPTDLPVIKAAASFPTDTTLGLLDGNKYGANGLAWGATNVFFRQLRNLIFDTTAIPAGKPAYGVHWPSSQATAITNCIFRLAEGADSKHIGILIEEGSGGLLNDLEFHGGMFAASFGNQQYTARNLKFYNAQVAINQLWDWGWTYKNVHVENCGTGIQMADSNTASITLLDSSFVNVETAIKTIRNPGVSTPPSAGNLVIENVLFDDVDKILVGPQGTIIPGGSGEIVKKGFAMGHVYDPTGPTDYTGSDPSYFPVLPVLQSGNEYYARSKPHYENVPVAKFISARTFGAKGDGVTDDTVALNNLFNFVTTNPADGLIAFIDAGTYFVSDTVFIPPNAKITGEALASIILGGGPKFADITKPHPVVKVAIPGQTGSLEWSDTIVSTRGAAAGAKVVEYNLNTSGEPAGMWDVHIRVGGFAGSDLQLEQCPTTPTEPNVINEDCIASWMSMHITKGASNLFMENCWVWVADHDLEDPTYTQITVYAGRGLLIESTLGKIWLSASGVEHHTLYQYQLYKTQNIYMGQIQTETPYYQPNPPATVPFPRHKGFHDPNFAKDCAAADPNGPPCAMAWGLRVISSRNIVIFGAGLYSFFNNYSTDCCQIGAGARCQARIFELKNVGCENVTNVEAYNLNIVGTTSMVTRLGVDVALYKDNIAGFTAGIALYKHDA